MSPQAGGRRARHVPIRSCVSCRTAGDKRDLLRVVRAPSGVVSVDAVGKANGRGAYVCAAAACIASARRQRKLERSLGAEVPAEVYDGLLALMQTAGGG
ncbi:MAG TPA: YlxR family protein [Chthonomonadales bacterium]|nr:YlxR family protein [Chthonomonadales bacterium]